MIDKINIFSNKYPSFRASISDKDIESFKDAKQQFSDCYLMATLETLSHTENGRKVLKEQLQYDDNNPNIINCYLYQANGQREKYSIPTDTVINGYEKLYKMQDNKIVRSLDIATGEYEKKYKAKPWICRFTDNFKTYEFENNLPSHFMKIFTGIQPRVIGETDFNFDLTSKKNEVLNLFERMEKEKEHSFVIATGPKMLDGRTWHVYVLKDVNLENGTITVQNKRKDLPKTMSIDSALQTFKFIVGYFNSDLEKDSK